MPSPLQLLFIPNEGLTLMPLHLFLVRRKPLPVWVPYMVFLITNLHLLLVLVSQLLQFVRLLAPCSSSGSDFITGKKKINILWTQPSTDRSRAEQSGAERSRAEQSKAEQSRADTNTYCSSNFGSNVLIGCGFLACIVNCFRGRLSRLAISFIKQLWRSCIK